MLYDCVSCGSGIAEDARRCPYCGTGDAGRRAILAHGARVHYSRPDWKEQDAAKAAQDKANADRAFHLLLVFFLLGAAMGGWFLGSVTGGIIGFAIGVILGAVVGLFIGGVAVTIFCD